MLALLGRVGILLLIYFLFFLGPFGVYSVGMVVFLFFARISLTLLEENPGWDQRGWSRYRNKRRRGL
ncbi:hypothetical protein CGZ75_05280 [Paenibacillus herberti]|uniref:Uncharacterized protein n=1 Tax=Paenibacillus herberti TaxID=1619309 RepID=A0A229P1H3_9BACL|nr:hypothetical protein CGZ75_05280 [Paenibacillus herberti]